MTKNFLLFLGRERDYFHNSIKSEVKKFWKSGALEELTGLTGMGIVADYVKQTLAVPSSHFLSARGKMLRPILGYLTIEALGKNPNNFRSLLIISQLLHDASLVTDDIEDNASIRRNRPALHVKYGVDLAVNTANAFYYLPLHIIDRSKISKEEKEEALRIFIEAMNRIHIGQGLDILWHKNPGLEITQRQYLQMIKLKTSSFFRSEIRLAALLCKVNKSAEKRLIAFSESLGVAFQIMDDVLDVTVKKGEAEKFGKRFAQDITEGKKTLMVIRALKKASPVDKKRLIEILGTHTRRKSLLNEAISILEKYETIRYAQEFACALIEKAWGDFSKILKPSPAKEYLRLYCEFVIKRRF